MSLLGLITFPAAALGLGIGTNSFFDRSPPQSHRVAAVAAPEHCSRDRNAVELQDWRDQSETFSLKVTNLSLCESIEQGDIFVLEIHEGFWGWPWLATWELLR